MTCWRRSYRELGIDQKTIPSGPARAPFDHDTADVLAQFKPPVVSFHFGLPRSLSSSVSDSGDR